MIVLISLFSSLIFSQDFQTLSGDIIRLDNDFSRTCPTLVDSCIYVCGEGESNPCHPENLFKIVVDSSTGDTNTLGSRFRMHFPWEYEGETANKFTVRASWPCLSPTAVFASGNYAYFDVIGHEACPGTVQGSIWYGSDCQDDDGNIGSPECIELIGRFCFAPGDPIDWPEESDQSISTDVCDACWMSSPVWDNYAEGPYAEHELYPDECDIFDHCHHSEPESVQCGVGYLDGETVSIDENQIPTQIGINSIYPNPFNPVTIIQFDVVEMHHATSLQVFDISGRMIESLVNEKLVSGQYEIQWNASQYASGVYFLQMNVGTITQSKKMILLK